MFRYTDLITTCNTTSQQQITSQKWAAVQSTEHGNHGFRRLRYWRRRPGARPWQSAALPDCQRLAGDLREDQRGEIQRSLFVPLALRRCPEWFLGTYCSTWCPLLYYCHGIWFFFFLSPGIWFFLSQARYRNFRATETPKLLGGFLHIALLREITKPK